MTPKEYWQKELDKASELASANFGVNDSQVVAALLIAGQLQSINTTLDTIRSQLNQIEDSIANQ